MADRFPKGEGSPRRQRPRRPAASGTRKKRERPLVRPGVVPEKVGAVLIVRGRPCVPTVPRLGAGTLQPMEYFCRFDIKIIWLWGILPMDCPAHSLMSVRQKWRTAMPRCNITMQRIGRVQGLRSRPCSVPGPSVNFTHFTWRGSLNYSDRARSRDGTGSLCTHRNNFNKPQPAGVMTTHARQWQW